MPKTRGKKSEARGRQPKIGRTVNRADKSAKPAGIKAVRQDQDSKNNEAVKQPTAPIIGREKLNDEQAEQKKKIIMWVGISATMAVFFIAWIFSLKYEFRMSATRGDKNQFDWGEIRTELDKTMKQVKSGLEEIKQARLNASSTASQNQELTPERINLLKDKLLEEAAAGADNNPASSTINNKSEIQNPEF